MEKRKRAIRIKTQIEQMTGKKITDMLPAKDKVAIMEYLLQCPTLEMVGYNNNKYPTFLVECALMLINNKIDTYFSVLEYCRKMMREDAKYAE